jgi:hypothetical protein
MSRHRGTEGAFPSGGSEPTDPSRRRRIRDIQPGDVVLRSFGRGPEMPLRVAKVDEHLIYCATPDGGVGGWTFCRASGWEIDEDLGWGPRHGVSGSRLVKVIPR